MALALSSHAVAVPALLMSAPADAARPGKRACKALEDSPSSYADSSLHLAADGALPEELVLVVCAELDAPSLLAFGATCKRFAALAASDQLWLPLFTSRFGPPTKLHQAAASRFAGSWLALHKAKVLAARDAEPWRTPCDAELRAALAAMLEAPAAGAGAAGMTAAAAPAARQPAAPAAGEEQEGAGVAGSNDATELAVVFLVDGSGSVGEDDFSAMTGFLATAAQAAGALPHSKLAVVQFSNDTREELSLCAYDAAALEAVLSGMARLNGGTNIAAAVAKAGALLAGAAGCGPATRRLLVLLTDGRIDSYQAREAAEMAARLADEQDGVELWAWGVGRGVDAAALGRVIEGAGAGAGRGGERYVELRVRDDAPW